MKSLSENNTPSETNCSSQTIWSGLRLTLVCMVFFCGIYTVLVWGIAQLVPGQGQGLVLNDNGRKYYVNIGQKFSSDKYFWSRPSAVDFNAAGSGGSNKGPTNPEYLIQVKARMDWFIKQNPGVSGADIPSDLLTASGSGLDPDISLQGAKVQVKRISRCRKLPIAVLDSLIASNTEDPLWGVMGTTCVNVLKLNIELDRVSTH